MPKEVLELRELTGMTPARNGGSSPVLVSGVKANTVDGVVLPENTDLAVEDKYTIFGKDVSHNGEEHFISISYQDEIKLETGASVLALGSSTASEIDQLGNLVVLNDTKSSTPKVISFNQPVNYSPLFDREYVIMEDDVITAPDDIGSIRRVIVLNDSLSLLCPYGRKELYFLATQNIAGIGATAGDVFTLTLLEEGEIVDITGQYSITTDILYDNVYFLVYSKLSGDYYISYVDISAFFTGADTSDPTAFLTAGVAAYEHALGRVIVDTSDIPSHSRLSSIENTKSFVFLGCKVPDDGITWLGEAYSHEIGDTQDIMYSLEKSLADVPIAAGETAVAATFTVYDDVVAAGRVPQHKSLLPFMPYHVAFTDSSSGTVIQNNRLGGSPGAAIPYNYPIDEVVSDWIGKRGVSLYNHQAAHPMYKGFAIKVPGNCGISTLESGKQPHIYITGDMCVHDYETDICGMYVAAKDRIKLPLYDVNALDTYSKLLWREKLVTAEPADAVYCGEDHYGAGVIDIVMHYSGNPYINTAVRVAARNDWAGLPVASSSADKCRLVSFTWNGQQPRETDSAAYAGILYSYRAFMKAEDPDDSPWGYRDDGHTYWGSSGPLVPTLERYEKKHFSNNVETTKGLRGAVLFYTYVDNNLPFSEMTGATVVPDTTIGASVTGVSTITRQDKPPVTHHVGYGVYTLETVEAGITTVQGAWGLTDQNGIPTTLRPRTMLSHGYDSVSYVTQNYTYSTAPVVPVGSLYGIDESSITVVKTFDEVLSVTTAQTDESSLQNFETRYKYSFIYDGFQEGPLSSYYVDAARVLNATPDPDEWFPYKSSITISIPDNLPDLVSQRITSINVWACTLIDGEESEYYRLVESIPLSYNMFAPITGGRLVRVVSDTGSRGASFENITGYPETYTSPSVDRECQTTCSGYLFIGNVRVHDNVNKSYTGNTILRSLPGQPSLFDFSRDFVMLPFSPIVMREYNGRLYVFGKKNYAVVNPETLSVDHVSNTIGCETKHHIVANDRGLFVYYRQKIYAIDGAEVKNISMAIETTEVDDITTLKDLASATGYLVYCQSRDSLIFVGGDGDVVHAFSYGLLDGKWYYYAIEGDVAPIGVYERNGEVVVLTTGGVELTLFNGTTQRAVEIEWVIDMIENGHKATIYSATAYNKGEEVPCDITIVNSQELTLSQPLQVEIPVILAKPEQAINSIKLVIRRFVVK